MNTGIANTKAENLFPTVETVLTNRTGGALEKGDVVAIDVTGSDASVETYSAFDPATDKMDVHPFRNAIAVGAAQDDGWILAIATEALADDAKGTFVLKGVVDIRIADSTASGAFLAPASGSDSLVAEADGVARCAQALAANSSGGVAATPCVFDGYAVMFGPQAEVA